MAIATFNRPTLPRVLKDADKFQKGVEAVGDTVYDMIFGNRLNKPKTPAETLAYAMTEETGMLLVFLNLEKYIKAENERRKANRA